MQTKILSDRSSVSIRSSCPRYEYIEKSFSDFDFLQDEQFFRNVVIIHSTFSRRLPSLGYVVIIQKAFWTCRLYSFDLSKAFPFFRICPHYTKIFLNMSSLFNCLTPGRCQRAFGTCRHYSLDLPQAIAEEFL